jgi:hypothetical protein
MVVWCCAVVVLCWSAGVLGRPNPLIVIYLYLLLFIGALTHLCMHMVSELSASLLAWSRLAWDLFLRAVVISSNELMIINSALLFLTAHLAITPWLCFYHVFVAGAKRKRKRREERRCLV